MPTGRRTKLIEAVEEFLAATELCRRNLIATPFSGNVPHYDIIESGEQGGHLAIQVKAIHGPHWQFSITKFVDVEFDGERQVLGDAKGSHTAISDASWCYSVTTEIMTDSLC